MKTKTLLLTTLLALAALSVVSATEFDDLKAKRNDLVAKAIAPIDRAYADNLKRLVAKPGLDQTEKERIQVELDKIEESLGSAKKLTSIEYRRFVEGKKWKTPTGTTFHFKEDGNAYREYGKDRTTLAWRFVSENVVEVTGKGTIGGNDRTWYFKFESSSKAFYGDTIDKTVVPLERER